MILPKTINVHELNIEQLWKYFKVLFFHDVINKNTYNKVKTGINIIFDINTYIQTMNGIQTNIHIDTVNQIVYTSHLKSSKISMIEFNDEIDERQTLMINEIINDINDNSMEAR